MTRAAPDAGPVTVIGAGSWGTALAVHLGRRGEAVRLWGRDAALVAQLAAARENPWYLEGIRIPEAVQVTADAAQALAQAGLVIVAVPSHVLEDVVRPMASLVPRGALLVSAAKGIEARRDRRMSELLAGLLPGRAVAALSGPSFAREVALGQPTAVVAAAGEESVARRVQARLATREFRVYTNPDVVGVELGGAVKNVIAIATGLADGLGLGENARAALITRGLAEVSRLAVTLGGAPATLAGLAGLGDLVLTCTGSLSRNRALGMALARGQTVAQAEQGSRMVAEGVRTVPSVLRLAGAAGVTMPIAAEVAAVLFEGKPAGLAVDTLLARAARSETGTARAGS
jgi:glycerol-3-phosphate dehydrogenase (NAD(P)+)